MKLLVSHVSALQFWRSATVLEIEGTESCHLRSASRGVSCAADVKSLEAEESGIVFNDEYPLDVLVSSSEMRSRVANIKPHVWSERFAYGSFRRLYKGSNIYISTPEFVFLQLAAKLDVVELARLGNELCGGYSLLQHGGFIERKSLTTRAKLGRFIERSPDVPGKRRALEALRWVTDGCNSPRETITLLALCLPKRLGGFALPIPEVNPKIKVSKRLQKYVEGSMYLPDFAWYIRRGNKKIIVTAEYDSHEWHDDEERAEATRIRRNQFKTMGALTTSINKSQLKNAWRLEVAARQIARDLGLYRKEYSISELMRTDALLRQLGAEEL